MLASVACLCARGGRRLSARVVTLSRAAASRRTAGTHPAHRRPPWTPTPHGLGVRYLSTSSRGFADPLGSAGSVPEEEGSFGSLSGDLSSRRMYKKSSSEIQDSRNQEEEWDEEEEEKPRPRRGRRNTPYWYFLQCRNLIRDNKLQEALDLFSKEMLEGERLQPEEFNYTVLIGGCGRAGQLKKAFKLYNDMKKRALEGSDATYTALFNACAVSPSKPAGLQQALKLEQELRRKNFPLSTITYHALLKTHAVTNHLQACIHIFKEMLQNGHGVSQETFHYLLMGCLKDKDVGFRLALQIWQQMLKSGIKPDYLNYNLLLRTARDCGIGDPTLAADLLLRSDWGAPTEERRASRVRGSAPREDLLDIDLLERQLFIQAGSQKDRRGGQQDATSLVPVQQTEKVLMPVDVPPNLLEPLQSKHSGAVSFGSVSGASDRLALIGGGQGFLEKMAADGLAPDLRTLTLLADTMEPGRQSVQLLLRVAKQHQVKLDVAFFNSAIRRAARNGDLDGAKSVLSVMRQRNVSVDVQTFGSLALACERQKDGLQLLKDMEGAGLRPNVHVFSALIGRATRRLDYVYLKTLLKSMSEMGVCPNEVIIRQLEFAAQYPPNYDQYKSRNNYLVQIDGFRGYYQQWLQSMPAQDDTKGEEAEPQAGPHPAVLEAEVVEGLTDAQRNQRNQRAAARRFNSQKKDRPSSGRAALQSHS